MSTFHDHPEKNVSTIQAENEFDFFMHLQSS